MFFSSVGGSRTPPRIEPATIRPDRTEKLSDCPAAGRAAASLVLGSRCYRAIARPRRPLPRASDHAGSSAARGRRARESGPRTCRARRPRAPGSMPAVGSTLSGIGRSSPDSFFDPSTGAGSGVGFPPSGIAPITGRDEVLRGVTGAIMVEVVGVHISAPRNPTPAPVAAVWTFADRVVQHHPVLGDPAGGAGDWVTARLDLDVTSPVDLAGSFGERRAAISSAPGPPVAAPLGRRLCRRRGPRGR